MSRDNKTAWEMATDAMPNLSRYMESTGADSQIVALTCLLMAALQTEGAGAPVHEVEAVWAEARKRAAFALMGVK